ncbi:MAG TPA: polysaccharide pyruvyl transferase family protein [Lacisediminihabitans sp.]|jgi:polysaccharide pyruvyl transferase WcaK-like protein|nr:polysaccharide pyruvyl transferase family protein [Lacisediminihabitans sp.]HXD62009.1 polysaccharide pyruvyl transferase family protein [Lacisediminihabitans sp.]
MRILVLWADDASPNLGVRALGRGTEALARRVWPDAEVVFQNFGHRARELPFGRIRSLAKERVTGRLGMQRWLGDFDLAIDTRSGDSFADIYGLHRLAVMGAVGELTSQAGVPVVLGPQTIGPFSTRRGRALARLSLRRARVTMVRDTVSAHHAAALGQPASVLTTDVVFALPLPQAAPARDILLNVSGLLWNANPHVEHERYRRVVAEVYGELRASGRQVSLLAHVLDSDSPDNDVPALREFAAATAPEAELVLPRDLDEVRSAVASANLVIASRMHACLNALSVGTPAVPLAYSRKFDPLLRDLGWQHTVELRDDGNVAKRVIAQVEEPLREAVPALIQRAHRALAPAEDALRGLL